MRKQVILAVASLAVFLVGVYMAFGFAQALLVAGAVGAVFALVWESE